MTKTKTVDNKHNLDNARKSLTGVSIGDAFGDSFFGETNEILKKIASREIPETKWEFTDDTVMSIAIFEELEASGEINQDNLIKRFYTNHDGSISKCRTLLGQV